MGQFDDVKLDRSRVCGTVYPPEDGAHFEQDGFYFDNDGNLVENDRYPLADQKEKLKRIAADRRADRDAEKARQASLKKSGFDGADAPPAGAAVKNADPKGDATGVTGTGSQGDAMQTIGNTSGTLSLVKWARNELDQNVPWFTVAKAARDQYSFEAGSARALAEWMIDNGKISKDEVKAVRLD